MQSKIYSLYRSENPIVREAYSALTASLYTGNGSDKINTLVVTSTEPLVGKTSVATSIAITLASWGKKTLLIDLDMRKPTEKNADYITGAAQFLQGSINLEGVLYSTNIENLTYLPKGRINGNPVGLLCSDLLTELLENAKKSFNYIIIDTAPLDGVSDAAILASKADGAIMVAKMNKTTLDAINSAKESLESYNTNLLGIILNQVDKKNYKNFFKSYKYYNNLNRKMSKVTESKKGVMPA